MSDLDDSLDVGSWVVGYECGEAAGGDPSQAGSSLLELGSAAVTRLVIYCFVA